MNTKKKDVTVQMLISKRVYVIITGVGYVGWKNRSSWVRRPGCEMSNPHQRESH